MRSYCISCGQLMEKAESGLTDHHCPEDHTATTLEDMEIADAPPSYADRLSQGFGMLSDTRSGSSSTY